MAAAGGAGGGGEGAGGDGRRDWLPIEANPAVMTKYCAKLGLDTTLYKFYDLLRCVTPFAGV